MFWNDSIIYNLFGFVSAVPSLLTSLYRSFRRLLNSWSWDAAETASDAYHTICGRENRNRNRSEVAGLLRAIRFLHPIWPLPCNPFLFAVCRAGFYYYRTHTIFHTFHINNIKNISVSVCVRCMRRMRFRIWRLHGPWCFPSLVFYYRRSAFTSKHRTHDIFNTDANAFIVADAAAATTVDDPLCGRFVIHQKAIV